MILKNTLNREKKEQIIENLMIEIDELETEHWQREQEYQRLCEEMPEKEFYNVEENVVRSSRDDMILYQLIEDDRFSNV